MPEIKVLKAITPVEKEGTLHSPQLQQLLHGKEAPLAVHDETVGEIDSDSEEDEPGYVEFSRSTWQKYLEATDPLSEEFYARQLGKINLLLTSEKLVSEDPTAKGRDQESWTRRFTEASEQLYGEVSNDIAEHLLAEQMRELSALTDDPRSNEPASRALEFLGSPNLEVDTTVDNYESLSPELAQEIFYQMREYIGPAISLIESQPDKTFDQPEIAELVKTCLDLLKEEEPAWSEWSVVEPEDSGTISIDGDAHEVKIGKKRAPLPKQKLLETVVHEIGVHAYRRINAEKYDDDLAVDMPGYLDFEEGFATLLGRTVSGETEVSQTSKDTYAFIALAKGIHNTKLSRSELHEYITNIYMARSLHENNDANEKSADKRAHKRVLRIFRGGDGLEHGGQQAVFTKDVIYYSGYHKAIRFLNEASQKGVPVEDTLDYLFQAKFDPFNQRHTEHVGQLL